MQVKNEFFHLLRQLFQQHTSLWQQRLPDITKPQYAVMRAIAEHPGIEQVTLIDVAVSTKATLAEMLSRMEHRGLVRRENCPSDKRRRFIWLTAEGQALLEGAIPRAIAVDNEFLNRMTPEQQEQISPLILQMMNK